MNSNRRVLLFVLSGTGLFLLISLAGYFFGITWAPFKRVNLISDLIVSPPDPEVPVTDTTEVLLPPVIVEKEPDEDFALYQKPRFITNFRTDTNHASLDNFVKSLYELKSGKKRKVRIAYFGDSMIEGDLLTQTLRRLLQETFGGNGVGFVPITSPVSKFRMTAVSDYSNGWNDENFKEGKSNKLFLSGHLFRTNGDWVQIIDNTIPAGSIELEKSLLCGDVSGTVPVIINNKSVFKVQTSGLFNRIVLQKDKTTRIKLSVSNEKLPVYGVSFESESGVFVDNFSFRGITGIEFARLDSAFLRSISDNNPYDLIVFQYGVNLLFRPNDKNFSWYSKAMLPVINKIRNCFPQSDFLVVSTTDRAFNYKGEYKSAVGIDSLIRVQALLAYETGSVFYNQFQTMGGANSIVEWAKMKPSLANKDYVHPNHRGAEVLANYFFAAILNDYEKYVRSLK
jgi:hypothetical protein